MDLQITWLSWHKTSSANQIHNAWMTRKMFLRTEGSKSRREYGSYTTVSKWVAGLNRWWSQDGILDRRSMARYSIVWLTLVWQKALKMSAVRPRFIIVCCPACLWFVRSTTPHLHEDLPRWQRYWHKCAKACPWSSPGPKSVKPGEQNSKVHGNFMWNR